MRFPRLEALLGVPPEALDSAALDRAVRSAVPEGVDLDWKQQLYSSDDKSKGELAKDVAALANTAGGVLVLGVEDRQGQAAGLKPVPLSEGEQRRMREIVAARVRPFLTDLDIRQVPAEQANSGFYVIIVPRSADAPHAVLDQRGHLGYPVRDEEITRWLTESEVAVRYRDRFTARDALASRASTVHQQGATRLHRRLKAWLCISTVPTSPGFRQSSAASVARAMGFVRTWAAHTASPAAAPRQRADGGLTALPGVRRTILSSAAPYTGLSDDVHLELHHDGAGFGGVVVGTGIEPQDGGPPPPDVAVRLEDLEMQAQALVSLLAHHAVDVGAGGDLLFLGQLLLPLDRRPDQGPTPTAIHAPRALSGGWQMSPEKLPSSLTLLHTTATSVSSLLSEVTADARGSVRTAYPLAADVLAEFGVAEPRILRPDGTLRLDSSHGAVHEWAVRNHLLDLPE